MSESKTSLRLGTEEHFRWLHGIVKAVLILNLIDALFTLLWISGGLAREANPFLDQLVIENPVTFAIAKLALVGMGSLLLWRFRHRGSAVIAIFVAFLAYYLVLLWHIRFLGLLVGAWLVP